MAGKNISQKRRQPGIIKRRQSNEGNQTKTIKWKQSDEDNQKKRHHDDVSFLRARDGDRTRDPLLGKEVLHR